LVGGGTEKRKEKVIKKYEHLKKFNEIFFFGNDEQESLIKLLHSYDINPYWK